MVDGVLIVFCIRLLEEIHLWHEEQIQRFLGIDHHLSLWWAAAALSISFVYVLWTSRSYRRSLVYLQSHLKSRKAREELKLDLKFFGMRWIYFPVLTVAFGAGFFTLNRQVAAISNEVLNLLFGLPLVSIGGVWASAAVACFSFLALDFAAYAAHWLHHRVPVLWEFHKIHHRSRYLTPLTKYRAHIVDEIACVTLEGLISGLILGVGRSLVQTPSFGPEYFALTLFLTSNFFTLHLRHTHLWISFGVFNHVFLSPAHHQIHHSRLPRHSMKNYGVVLSLWDSLFGTLYHPRKRERFAIGLDEPYDVRDLGLWKEFIRPFAGIAKRNSGYSMIELMVGLALGSIVILLATALIVGYVSLGNQTSQNAETLAKLNQATMLVRELASRAVDVRLTNVNLGGMASTGGEGYVRRWTYDNFNDLTTQPSTPIMYFTRETQNRNQAPRLIPTAVFFRAPTQTTPGALIFDLGGDYDSGVLAPTPDDLVYDDIVGIKLARSTFDPGNSNAIERVELSITMRTFLPSPTGKNRVWCPQANIAMCGDNIAAFVDQTKAVVLNFANNRRAVVNQTFEFPYGFYLLKTTVIR